MRTILGLEREVNLHLSRHCDECGDYFHSHCRAAVELQRYLNQAIRYLNDSYPTEKINTIRLNCRHCISEIAFRIISLTPTLLHWRFYSSKFWKTNKTPQWRKLSAVKMLRNSSWLINACTVIYSFSLIGYFVKSWQISLMRQYCL